MVAFAELWERASFYSIVSLLAIFAVAPRDQGGMGISKIEANLWAGNYTLMAFGLPIIFGLIGDRILGHYRAVVLGAAIIVSGHAVLFIGDPTNGSILWMALWLIASGTGLLKPAMPCIVSSFYDEDQVGRDRAFKFYYMMINIGAVLGAGVVGMIHTAWGFEWAFLWAGLGMLVAMALLLAARPLVPAIERGRPTKASVLAGEVLDPIAADRRRFKINTTMLCTLFALFLVWSLAYGFFAGSATSELIGKSYVDRVVLGWEFPAEFLYMIEPGIIVIATPLLAWGLSMLARRGRFPDPVYQMVLGALLACAAVMLLGWLVTGVPEGAKNAPVIALASFIGAYAFMSVGEILIAPVYMAVITRLAPRRQQGTWQGAMLLGIGLMSFGVSRVSAVAEADGGVRRAETFIVTGLIALVVVGAFVLASPWIVRIIRRANGNQMIGDAPVGEELEALAQLDAGEPAIGVKVEPLSGDSHSE
ncbi:MAG: MFS transporter [Phycisphaerales bacterium]|nr:MFS transporter [Phycisphaerales bacterium]